MSITGGAAGAAVAAMAWLAGTGVAGAATSNPNPVTASAAISNQCPIPGSYGDGSTTSAYQAYAAISPTTDPNSSRQLAFTGGNFAKEFAAGGLLIGAGAILVFRSRRRPLMAADGSTEADFPDS